MKDRFSVFPTLVRCCPHVVAAYAVESREKWRKLVVRSSVVPHRLPRLRDSSGEGEGEGESEGYS